MVKIKGWLDLLPDWVAIWDGQGEAEGDGEGKGGDGGERWGGAGCCWWALVGTGPTKTWENTPQKKKKTKHLPLPASPSHPQTSPRSPAQHFPVPPGALSQFLIHFWSRRAGRKPREGLPSPKRARRASRQTGSQHGLSQFLPASAMLFMPRVFFYFSR